VLATLATLTSVDGIAAAPGAAPATLKSALPDDIVVLYVVAHGEFAAGRFLIVPADASDTDGGNRISDSDLGEVLRRIDAERIVVVLDTCHSRGAGNQPGFKPGPFAALTLPQLIYDKGVIVLTAADVAERAGTLAGTFLTLIKDALIRNNVYGSQGSANLNALFAYVENELPALRARQLREAEREPQTPRFLRLSRRIVQTAEQLKIAGPRP
jgi:hypothetical protein